MQTWEPYETQSTDREAGQKLSKEEKAAVAIDILCSWSVLGPDAGLEQWEVLDRGMDERVMDG